MKKLFYYLLPLCLLYNLSNSNSVSAFRGSIELKWPSCANLNSGVIAISTRCDSEPFVSKGGYLRLEYAAKSNAEFLIKSLNKNETYWFSPKRIYKAKSDKDWNLLEFQAGHSGEKFILESSSNVKIRTRATFYSREANAKSIISSITLPLFVLFTYAPADHFGWNIDRLYAFFSYIPSIIVAVFFAHYILKLEKQRYLYFFLASLLVHFRHDVYFYFDEWTLLNVFQQQNIFSYRHNEHYLPIFFWFFKLETKLFGLNYWLYLLVSNLIHAFNALMIFKISNKIFSNQKKLSEHYSRNVFAQRAAFRKPALGV